MKKKFFYSSFGISALIFGIAVIAYGVLSIPQVTTVLSFSR